MFDPNNACLVINDELFDFICCVVCDFKIVDRTAHFKGDMSDLFISYLSAIY